MAYAPLTRSKDGKHRVAPGDTVSSVAASYGITEWESRVWNAPENAQLKQQRVNPNTLAPGDEIFIPELGKKQEGRPTDDWHDFHVVRNKRFLRLKLQNSDGSPIKERPYRIEPVASFRGAFVQQNQATDADGKIEEEIPHTMIEATLVLPEDNLTVKLMIGHLQPLPATDPVKAPDLAGALDGLASAAGGLLGDAAGAVSGGVGSLAGSASGALSGVLGAAKSAVGGLAGTASGGVSVGSGGVSAGGSGGGGIGGAIGDVAGAAKTAAGGLAGAAKGVAGAVAGKVLASASAMVGAAAGAVAGALGPLSLGNEKDPNIYPAAQRLLSIGFRPGDPRDNKRTPQFSAALMEFQTWCKKQGQLDQDAGGPLGSLTSPGGLLGGGGGPLGAIAGAVAGPLLASVGLTGQLDQETIEALKKVHGC